MFPFFMIIYQEGEKNVENSAFFQKEPKKLEFARGAPTVVRSVLSLK